MSAPTIEQSYAVHRQETSPIDQFWAWFKENTDLLASFEDRGEQVVEEVETYLKAVHEDLTFELGQDDDGTFEFVISADGVNISLEILTGTGSPSNFDYLGFGGFQLGGDLSQLESMKRLQFHPIFTGVDSTNTYGAVEIKIGPRSAR